MAGFGPNGGVQGVSNATTPFTNPATVTNVTATGTFTTQPGTTLLDYLVVGGGGGGASRLFARVVGAFGILVSGFGFVSTGMNLAISLPAGFWDTAVGAGGAGELLSNFGGNAGASGLVFALTCLRGSVTASAGREMTIGSRDGAGG